MDPIGGFMSLPHELVQKILVLCDPLDVAMISMSCRRMWEVVYGDLDVEKRRRERREGRGFGWGERSFWRSLYLAQPLDDPRVSVNRIGISVSQLRKSSFSSSSVAMDGQLEDDGIDWEEELKRVIRARSIVINPHACKGEEELQQTLSTLLDLAECVPPLHGRHRKGNEFLNFKGEDEEAVLLAKNLVWVPVVARNFLDLVEGGLPTGVTRGQYHLPPKSYWQNRTIQLHSQLRTLYGLTRRDLTKRARLESREYVYDMRKYKAENEYGPLVEGGRYVNWVHVEKIHHVISMHIVWDLVKEWAESDELEKEDSAIEGMIEYMIYPMSMPFTQTVVPRRGEGGGLETPPVDEEDVEGLAEDADWAGVEGDWTIFFCFYDHRQLIGARGR
jgi:hypothetical protein